MITKSLLLFITSLPHSSLLFLEESEEESEEDRDSREGHSRRSAALVLRTLLGKAVSLEDGERGTAGTLVLGEARTLLLVALADEVRGPVGLDRVVVAVEELLAALTSAPRVAGTVSTPN